MAFSGLISSHHHDLKKWLGLVTRLQDKSEETTLLCAVRIYMHFVCFTEFLCLVLVYFLIHWRITCFFSLLDFEYQKGICFGM
jgi:hypothetical protein